MSRRNQRKGQSKTEIFNEKKQRITDDKLYAFISHSRQLAGKQYGMTTLLQSIINNRILRHDTHCSEQTKATLINK